MRLIPFHPDHLNRMVIREFEAGEMLLLGNAKERACEYLTYGPAFTGICGEQFIGCGGLIILWPGVAEAWAVSTLLWPSKALSVHKAILTSLNELSATLGLWRIQTAVNEAHQVSCKWVERLGFKFEGAMPGYGPDGATYLRFGRVCLDT